jgi:hypothetical protein
MEHHIRNKHRIATLEYRFFDVANADLFCVFSGWYDFNLQLDQKIEVGLLAYQSSTLYSPLPG